MTTGYSTILSSHTTDITHSGCTFKPIQTWDQYSLVSYQLKRTKLGSSEGESRPYGIQETVDEILNVCTEDLFLDMCERQVDYVCPSAHNPNATYIPYRRYLVDWMSDIGDQCRLHNTTVHASVLFLDKIFRSRDIPRSQWQLLASACISVAAKYEEAEGCCPHIPDLLHMTRLSSLGYNSLSFREGELKVLRYLGWRLRAVTPLHIIGYFLSKGVIFENDSWKGQRIIEKIPRYLKKYADFFCNLTLQDYAFQQYLPSKLASAILLASRVSLHIQPRWRPELTRLTGYEEKDVLDVFHHVWMYYEEQFPDFSSRSISPKSVVHDNFYC